MSNPQKIFKWEAAVMNLVPDFPARSLGGRQIVHHPNRNTVNECGKGDATVAGQPIGQILKRLKNIVANLFRVVVGDKRRLFHICNQQRPWIKRTFAIKAGNIWTLNESKNFVTLFSLSKEPTRDFNLDLFPC